MARGTSEPLCVLAVAPALAVVFAAMSAAPACNRPTSRAKDALGTATRRTI